ncbi:hypothetical protein FQZ97_678480 [compost metagenome]
MAVLQAHLVAGEQAEEALGLHVFVVGALDPDFAAELEFALAHLGVVRVHGGGAVVERVVAAHQLTPVGDDELHRVEHGHGARRDGVEGVAQRGLEAGVFDPAAGLGGAAAFAEQLQRGGRVAAAAQAGDGGHARVVPAVDVLFLDELAQLALAGHHVGHVQAGELVLARVRAGDEAAFGQAVEQPVVEGALVFEFERADGVGDLLQRVFDGVRVGVHRVDAPLVARVVVRGPADAVQRGVAHVDVGARHVDLGAQDGGAVGELAVAHLAKARQVFVGRAAAKAAVGAGRVEVAAVGAHFFGRLLVDIGQAGADQVLGGFVHEVEVVAGEVLVFLNRAGRAGAVGQVGFVAEPLHGVADGIDVLLLFLLGVGVVEAQVAHAAVFLGQLEIQPDALGVADVQVAVGLGRKAHAHLGGVGHALGVVGGVARGTAPGAACVGTLCEVVLDHVAQEIARCSGRFGAAFVGRGGHRVILEGGLSGLLLATLFTMQRPPALQLQRSIRTWGAQRPPTRSPTS